MSTEFHRIGAKMTAREQVLMKLVKIVPATLAAILTSSTALADDDPLTLARTPEVRHHLISAISSKDPRRRLSALLAAEKDAVAAKDWLGAAAAEFDAGLASSQLNDPTNKAKSNAGRLFAEAGKSFGSGAFRKESALSFFHSGDSYDDAGDDRSALIFYKKALALYNKLRDELGTAKTLNGMGVAASNPSLEPEVQRQALMYYQGAGRAVQQCKDAKLRAEILFNLGAQYIAEHHRSEAVASLYASARSWMKAPKSDEKGSALFSAGHALMSLGASHRALEILKAARRVVAKPSQASIQITNQIGQALIDLSRYLEADAEFGESLKASQETNNEAGQQDALTGLGKVYAGLGRTTDALECFSRALQISSNAHADPQSAGLESMIADLSESTGAYEEAKRHYSNALSLLRSLRPTPDAEEDYKRQVSSVVSDLGVVYDDLADEDQALEYANEALKMKSDLHDWDGVAKEWSNIAHVYGSLGQTDKALEMYHIARSVLPNPDTDTGAICLVNIGAIYASRGDINGALKNYDEALPVFDREKDLANECTTLTRVGRIFLAKAGNRPSLVYCSRALQYFNDALPVQRTLNDRRGESDSLSNMGRALSHLGEYSKAFVSFSRALPIEIQRGDKRGQSSTLSALGTAAVADALPDAGIAFLKRSVYLNTELQLKLKGLSKDQTFAFNAQNRETYLALETALASQGRTDEASYVKAIELGDEPGRALPLTPAEDIFLRKFDELSGVIVGYDGKAAELQRLVRPSRDQEDSLKTLREQLDSGAQTIASYISSSRSLFHPGQPVPKDDGHSLTLSEATVTGPRMITASVRRTASVDPEDPSLQGLLSAKRIALIFSSSKHYLNTDYQDLENPDVDAEGLKKVLEDKYKFTYAKIIPHPDFDQINDAIDSVFDLNSTNPADEILLYFAGHGCEVTDSPIAGGYVVLTSSQKGDRSMRTYFPFETLRTSASRLKANHVLVILDVCYAADFDPKIFRPESTRPVSCGQDYSQEELGNLMNYAKKKSRQYIASGARDVYEGVEGKGSPFSKALLQRLREPGKSWGVMARSLGASIADDDLRAESHNGSFSDNDENGEFIFMIPPKTKPTSERRTALRRQTKAPG